ncbi:MAG: hemerythrin domain-containing protein, partial [Rhodospirillaceae bacterium]|nr:hemerythrin domain-containing protein [Rhodospirillaceae bacterium]
MMKRHPSLQPLSREHHQALVHCRTLAQKLESPLSTAWRTAAAALQQYWDARFSSHMADEEHVLLDVLSSSLRSRLLNEHDRLRAQFGGLDNTLDPGRALVLDDLASLAATVRAHIRWEEHVVFPYIQSHVPPDELQSLGDRLHSRRASDAASCGLRTPDA